VKHVIDAQLERDVQQFRLQYVCEQCAYFEPSSETCSEGYPNHEHRQRPLLLGAELCFCKLFEMA
jgi:hypothetical protein